MAEIKKSICPYDCPSTCGFEMEVEDGKIIRVRNQSDHPVSCNGICRKTQHYEKSIYSRDRIMTPLRRTGPKGSGSFTPVSWDEAITKISEKWKEIIRDHGAKTILPCTYSGVMSDIQNSCGDAFFNRMGAADLVRTLCSPAKSAGYAGVVGKTGCLDPRELNDSDFYIIWGSNMAATRLQALADLMKPANRKKKKILIDTYANPTARYCDRTLCIKAGSDGALALAMMHVLDREGLIDEEFVKEYTEGFEELRKTLGRYTPEWAESETGIAAEDIRNLAREYAHADAPAIILGSGNSRHRNGGMTVRLIVIFSLLTGAWKKPGGGLCGCTPIATPYVNLDLITRPDFRKGDVPRYNINQLGMALENETVRSFYVYGANPANTVSDQDSVMRGLAREDLFTVVHERFMTETALYADIILPATFSVEHHDIYRCYGYCTLGTAWPLVKPPGECKSNWDVFGLLASAMGYEEDYFRQSEEEMLLYILDHPTEAVAGLGEKDKETLRRGGSVSMPFSDHLKVGTPSGRFRIVNEDLPEALPYYIAPAQDQAASGEEYPLHLIAAPSLYSLNSEFRDLPDLMERRGEQKLIIHSQDAAQRGIEDGQMVLARNDLSEVAFRAVVTDRIARGSLVCEGIFRRDSCRGGRAFNALTSQRLSDLGEGTTMNDNRVEVIPLHHRI